MAGRSTRNKIRFQFEQIIKKLDGILGHLQKAEEVSYGGHPRLNAALPDLTQAIDALRGVMATMRDDI